VTLSPLNAVAVTPRAWDVRREKDITIERHLLGIMSKIETQFRRGATDTGIREVIVQVVGEKNAAKVKLDSLSKRGAHRGTLFIACAHPIYAMELRPFLPALKAALQPMNISDVRLR
jgi:hypothetical protein